jgi:hypothetical protein
VEGLLELLLLSDVVVLQLVEFLSVHFALAFILFEHPQQNFLEVLFHLSQDRLFFLNHFCPLFFQHLLAGRRFFLK